MRNFETPIGVRGARLTAYLPDASDLLSNARKRPSILVIPGGGYHFCSDREAEPIALSYLAEGWNAFVLRYTVGQGTEIPLAEAGCAMRLLREKEEEWNMLQNRIAAIGFSAGGHLAAMLSVQGEDRPDALLLGYAVTRETYLSQVTYPSAVDRIDGRTPPTFLFCTSEDEIVPAANTLEFAQALARARVPFETHIYQKGRHGLSLAKPLISNGFSFSVDERFAQWFSTSVKWLKSMWGDFPSEKS